MCQHFHLIMAIFCGSYFLTLNTACAWARRYIMVSAFRLNCQLGWALNLWSSLSSVSSCVAGISYEKTKTWTCSLTCCMISCPSWTGTPHSFSVVLHSFWSEVVMCRVPQYSSTNKFFGHNLECWLYNCSVVKVVTIWWRRCWLYKLFNYSVPLFRICS